MKIIVVGASGYIGEQLYNAAKISGVTYGTTSTSEKFGLRLRLDQTDDFDYSVIHCSDLVFVAAALSSPDICSKEYDRAWAVNVTGTSAFISRAISRGARVIFFSSDTVYGERINEFDESTNCNPAGDYAIMKHEVEKRFLGNPSFKTIRLSYVFSREDKFTKYLCGCAERGEEAEIFHPFYRAVVHRDDVVKGALSLAMCWGEFPQSVINFGGPNVISRIEFAQAMKETVLPKLHFRKIEPQKEFFINRPSIIKMKSPLLESLLGRPACSLRQAAQLEF